MAKRTLAGFTLILCLVAVLFLVMGSFQIALADEPGPRPTRTPTHTPLPSDTPVITITYTPPATLTSTPFFKLYLPIVSRPKGIDVPKPGPTATQTGGGPGTPGPLFWAYLFILFAAAAVVVVIITFFLWRQKKHNNP